ncbi:MAG: cytochrome c biogenesis protein CcsA [Akkermansia sp.]|nr:cytochrome c biogenesis protein CcsA [Akkermansia sp.]
MITVVYALTIFSLLLCLGSVLAAVLKRHGDCRRAFDAAWVAALLLFVADWVLAQAPPFGNMRHVLAFFPLVMVPAAHYLRRFRGLELTAWLAAASAIALVGALSMPLQAAWRQMPALQSPWFAPHVVAYVVSYGLMTVAALLTLASFRCDARLAAADAVVRLSLPFMTFGLWSGALWADAAWGGYWAWDIKEAWSLLTWCIYLIYLHVERYPAFASWRRPLLLLGFAAVVVTFLVVNLLPKIESMHSYAQ